MSKYELIAFDMDGTLLDSKKQVRPDSLLSIKKAVKNNKLVALSTGRSIPELTDSLAILKDVQYVISASGALVFDAFTGNVIYKCPMEEEIVKTIFKRIKKYDVMVHIHSDVSLVQKDKVEKMECYNMAHYKPMFENITVKVDELADYIEKNHSTVYKFNIYCKSEEDRAFFMDLLKDLPIEMVYSEHTSLECSQKGVSKGEGLVKLCNYLNIQLEQSIAVGDADNDIAILKTAGLAVAMGNANSNVKHIAHVVVADNDSGGCSQAIEQFLLQ